MSRRRITIETDEKNDRMIVRGWRGGDLAREAGCWPLWIGSVGGWVIDLPRLPDLVAYLEYRNIAVSVAEWGGAK